ncbi:hypothetical protein GGTG_07305 [Gaeumannomyces tritici R3-111a-1]|uniref:Uncharacterized protein n=1 Tax=Gaeumannomyces tritici (strain R3-111a-1) TaxID=644352 RepID=J3P1A8_GAET3|nr:hypothetical protein GGTG_07305 [Gaeumannomyces tritici R3-111a-1]EJT77393.1 hypothetical protein GGTG_07305 [Gaeumannomyces tritici R3-111a-1]
MDPDMFPPDSETLFREFLQHGRFHASPRAPEQMPAHAHWAPPPYQRGPAYPPRRVPAYDHHSQPAGPPGPFFYVADGTGWNPALQPMIDHVRRYAAWHNGPPPTTQYGTVPIAGLWPSYDPAQDIHTRGSRGDSNWPGQAVHGSVTMPPSFPAYTDGSDRHTQANGRRGRSTCPRAPESASAEQHKNPAARAAGRGSVSSASTGTSTSTSTSSRSSRGAATVAFTDSNNAPPAPRPFTQDYSLRGPDGAGEPTRCVVSLVVDGRVSKYIYISPSVCPSCSAHDDDNNNNDDDKGKGRTGYYYYCANPRRRGSFTSTAAIINGQVGHGPGPGHVGPGHRCIRLSARTAASDEGLEIFLKLLHTPDPSSSSSRHLLPFLSTDAAVKETRRQVVVDIIDAIYDTRETIRRKKTGYGQRDPLKAQLACLGLWPGHHDAGYRSHPPVRESVAALMGRVKRAADAAAARGDNGELILLVDRIRAIVDAVHLPLP